MSGDPRYSQFGGGGVTDQHDFVWNDHPEEIVAARDVELAQEMAEHAKADSVVNCLRSKLHRISHRKDLSFGSRGIFIFECCIH